MAQLGGILVAEHFDWDKRVVLAKVGSAKFHKPAIPGDQLIYRVQLDGTQEHGASISGTSHCNGELQAEIDLMFAFLEEGRFAEGSLFNDGDLAAMLRIMNLFNIGVDAQGNPLAISSKI
jgi:3-hydroxyacyl-[acyl-carrier-protein] dehydratase